MRDKKKGNKVLFFILLLTLFLMSFAVSGYIYINSKNLVFSPHADDMREMALKIGEKDNRITELEEELERYKALYEEAVKNSETVFAPENR